ncbi:zinc transporter ZIP11-like isoform X1 [Orbicella faveolata]|uniref:zinc transporter ZIP11-like isoform X1 n=2 Tax=Orbicella faveolata TaxID=48498 RepID=UPI0009E3A8E5|nr:zinc transporter ZIP11-like isoform X1 [Orbicella faveolata]
MIPDYNPVTQALLGTLFTWAVTALGSALVFVFNSGQRKILDASLGFAAGVMLAASYWSLLAPAIEMAEISGSYGKDGKFAFIPVSVGFVLGAVFVYGADKLMPFLGVESSNITDAITGDFQNGSACKEKELREDIQHTEVSITNFSYSRDTSQLTQRKRENLYTSKQEVDQEGQKSREQHASWRRILLLIIAITVHNIPEGLAVGVGFGAIGKTASATFENARNLAIGIGIQNFPEGLAVSLPLRGAGFSSWKSFWYGQLSGMVEPIAGLFGAFAVVVAEPLLPYALAFAAGAMIYVVVDDIIPEAQTSGNGRLASCTTIVGFVVMMSLDVGLG